MPKDKKTISSLILATMLFVFILMFIYIIFNLRGKEIMLSGLGLIFLGLIQFYLKNRIWYLWWTLVPAKPIYVKILGWFFIFVGLLFVFIGVI